MRLKSGIQTSQLKHSRTMSPESNSNKAELDESLCIWLNSVDIGKSQNSSGAKDGRSTVGGQSMESKKIDLKKAMNLQEDSISSD